MSIKMTSQIMFNSGNYSKYVCVNENELSIMTL